MGGWEIILPSSHPHHATHIIPRSSSHLAHPDPTRSYHSTPVPSIDPHPAPPHLSLPSRSSQSHPHAPGTQLPSSHCHSPYTHFSHSHLPSPPPPTTPPCPPATLHPPPLKMTPVGFEPTPFRNGALSHRLRPLGQSVVTLLQVASLGPFFAQILDPAGGMGCSAPPTQAAPAGATHKHGTELLQGWVVGGRVAQDSRPGAGSGPHG